MQIVPRLDLAGSRAPHLGEPRRPWSLADQRRRRARDVSEVMQPPAGIGGIVGGEQDAQRVRRTARGGRYQHALDGRLALRHLCAEHATPLGDPSHDPRYRSLDPSDLPSTECLKDTVERFLPLWHDEIAPAIRRGERVLIAAHGNSLRALVKYLDGISDADIVELNIPTGIPLIYELDANLKPIKSYYLGDPDAAKKAAERVAAQAAAKPQR